MVCPHPDLKCSGHSEASVLNYLHQSDRPARSVVTISDHVIPVIQHVRMTVLVRVRAV